MTMMGPLDLRLKFREALNNNKYVCKNFLSEQSSIQSG